MQDFFFEFEEYVRKNYGEKHFFKTLLEDSIQPLHDALEDITSGDIIESIFGDIDTTKFQKALGKLKLPELSGTGTGGASAAVARSAAPRESGLSAKVINVNIKSIDKNVLDAMGGKNQGKISSIGGGVGKAAAGLGIAGAAIGGIISIFSKFGEFDADKIKDNVVTLLSISDEVGGKGEMLKEGGAFVLSMAGIGLGLAVFGIGSGVAGLADGLLKMGNPKWAKSIVDSVVTLLSISEEVGGKGELLKETGAFYLSMVGISAGLAVFSVASGVAGLADGITKMANPKWAESIVKSVVTLLSISELLGGKEETFSKTGTFFTMMMGIGAGLAIFGGGKAAEGMVAGITGAISFFTKESQVERIVREVGILLTIGDNANMESAVAFEKVMGKISSGLGKIAKQNLWSSLTNVGTSIISWMSGENTPMAALLELAENGPKLKEGADAIALIGDSLGSFGAAIGGGMDDFNFEKMAKNMGDAIPFFEALYNGGPAEDGWFGGKMGATNFGKGLKGLEEDGDLGNMVKIIDKMNFVLGRSSINPDNVEASSSSEINNNKLKEADVQYNKRRQDLKDDLSELLFALGNQINTGAGVVMANVVNAVNGIPVGGETVVTNNTYYTSRDVPTVAQRNAGRVAVGG